MGKHKVWKAFDGRSPERLKYLGEESCPNSNVLADGEAFAVSYTHLTLPTIYSV